MRSFERFFIIGILVVAGGALAFSGYLLIREIFPPTVDYGAENDTRPASVAENKERETLSAAKSVKKAIISPNGRKIPHGRKAKPPRILGSKRAQGSLSLVGVVQDGQGNPIPEASVRILTLGAYQSLRNSLDEIDRAVSDNAGAFFFKGIPPGIGYTLELVHRDFSPRQERNLEIPEGDFLDAGTLVLSKGGQIKGRITDTQNKGIEGAQVFARLESQGRGSSQFISGPFEEENRITPLCCSGKGGDYVIVHAPTDRATLLVVAPAYNPTETPPFEVKEGMEKELNIPLGQGATLQGQVVDEANNTVPEAFVTILPGKLIPNPIEMKTDSQGRFSLPGIAYGRAVLITEAEGYSMGRQAVNISNSSETFVTIKLLSNGSISGAVLSAQNGKPVPGAEVVATSPFPLFFKVKDGEKKTQSNEQGKFKIENVSPGTYVLIACAKGFAPTSSEQVRVDVGAESSETIIQLKQGGKMEGTVLAAKGGAPVCDASVVLRKAFPGARGDLGAFIGKRNPLAPKREEAFPVEPAASGKDGFFGFSNIPEGEYFLEASHPEFSSSTSDRIVVHEGGVLEGLRILCYLGGAIQGTATDEKGSFLSDRQVLIMDQDRTNIRLTTNEKGEFFQEGLTPGEYKIKLLPKGASGRRAMFYSQVPEQANPSISPDVFTLVLVEEGKTATVTLVEKETSKLCGIVKVNGRPEKGLDVSVYCIQGKEPGVRSGSVVASRNRALTNSEGYYELAGLIPGTYSITVKALYPQTTLHQSQVEIHEDEKVQEDFDIEAGSLKIVVVSSSSNQPIDGARILISPKLTDPATGLGGLTPRPSHSQTDKNGCLEIPFIKPGTYMINSWKTGYRNKTTESPVLRGENELIVYMDSTME